MPNMRKSNVIAILCSDLHLRMKRPPCRSDQVDWFAVMRFYLQQLKKVAKKHDSPIICAGDIFDKWNSPAELIAFALKELPDGMYCIPGQHDLPAHNYGEMKRSAYGCLVEAGKIVDLKAPTDGIGKYVATPNAKDPRTSLYVHGFPWGHEIKPPNPLENEHDIQLAAIHAYCWTKGHLYPGADESTSIGAYRKQLIGYNAAVFGDNHKGFRAVVGNTDILNNGGFIRMKSDELDYTPSIGLLHEDGSIKRALLDTSIDVFETLAAKEDLDDFDMSSFMRGLEALAEGEMNFTEAVERYLKEHTNEITEGTENIVREIITYDTK